MQNTDIFNHSKTFEYSKLVYYLYYPSAYFSLATELGTSVGPTGNINPLPFSLKHSMTVSLHCCFTSFLHTLFLKSMFDPVYILKRPVNGVHYNRSGKPTSWHNWSCYWHNTSTKKIPKVHLWSKRPRLKDEFGGTAASELSATKLHLNPPKKYPRNCLSGISNACTTKTSKYVYILIKRYCLTQQTSCKP